MPRKTRETLRLEALEAQIAEVVSTVRANPGQRFAVFCGHVRSRPQLEERLGEHLTTEELSCVQIEWAAVLNED